ncbi:hypothetical protein ES703_09224 [subsurface metagenome]
MTFTPEILAQSAGAVFLKAQSFWVRLSIRPPRPATARKKGGRSHGRTTWVAELFF